MCVYVWTSCVVQVCVPMIRICVSVCVFLCVIECVCVPMWGLMDGCVCLATVPPNYTFRLSQSLSSSVTGPVTCYAYAQAPLHSLQHPQEPVWLTMQPSVWQASERTHAHIPTPTHSNTPALLCHRTLVTAYTRPGGLWLRVSKLPWETSPEIADSPVLLCTIKGKRVNRARRARVAFACRF